MPLYDVGYRRWEGQENGWLYRMLAITKSGIKIIFKSLWVKISLVIGWILALAVGGSFFAFEQYSQQRHFEVARILGGKIEQLANKNDKSAFLQKLKEVTEEKKQEIVQAYVRRNDHLVVFFGRDGAEKLTEITLFGDEKVFRREVWSRLLLMFFRMPQGMTLLIMIGWIAPPLISKDIRTKAFLLYFSRPLSRLSYIGGKFMILVGISSMLATFPGLLLYLFAVALSPDTGVIWDTWDLPCKIVLASMIHIIPCSLLALALSSLTSESRYAMFGWFAIWGLGALSWTVISLAKFSGRDNFQSFYQAQSENDPFFIFQFGSIYHVIADAQSAAMGLENGVTIAYACMAYTVFMSLCCFAFLWYRIGKVTSQ